MSEFGFGFFSVEALRLLLTVNSGVQRRCWCGSCGVSKRVGCVLSVLWLPKRVRQPQLDVSCDVHAYSKHFAFKQPQTFKQPLTRYFYISCFESVNLSALTSCHSAPSTSAYLAELAIKQQLIFWRKSHLCLMPLPGLNPHVSLLYSLNMVGQIRSGDFLAHFEKQNWFIWLNMVVLFHLRLLVSATEHHMSSWCPLFLKWTKKAFIHIGVCLMV